MRKLLLGTTAVAAAALFGASHASAQTAPTVRIGGFFEFTGGYIDDDADRNAVTIPAVGTNAARTVSRDKVDFRSDAEIHILVSGKAANGLTYGAAIELQVDNVTNSGGAGNGGVVDTDEMWMYISSPTLGQLQLGDQDNAADQLKVSTPGIQNLDQSGGWDEFTPPSGDGSRYLVTGINDGVDSTKIIYLSPQFFGFDFGISYAANQSEGENFLTPTGGIQRDGLGLTNEISGAVRYRGTFGGVGVATAFSAMRADAQESNGVLFGGVPVGLEDVTQYQAGLNLSAYGLTVGGYYSWGKFSGATRGVLREGLDNSTNWGAGATYRMGAFEVGAFFAEASRDNGTAVVAGAQLKDREQQLISVGAVYTLAPGLEMFANYTNIDNKNIANNATNPTNYASQRNRTIDVFIVGTRLSF
ncbi:putative porin [Humitalea rosea]|uniref:Putative porin n=1 Tax=Humitalea rosea TaxID=990373 RepID=A0A2W7IMT6_9PROT|nr:porin [Humitalea rosea]PZW46574.1 putative porin [Humitalea rosea]